MKKAFFKLHLSVLIASTTALFGKMVDIHEFMLAWYRVSLAAFVLVVVIAFFQRAKAMVPLRDVVRIASVGLLIAFHWIFFYGSIKASNVSVGVVCFSLVGLFTALFDPIVNKHRFSIKEMIFSLLTLAGIILIFHFDTRYRWGIILGVISSALAALFTVNNKRLSDSTGYSSSTLLLYEMIGGSLALSLILPVYMLWDEGGTVVPPIGDIALLFVLASVCTVGLYLLQIQVLKEISSFTVSLSYNLEPIYSIVLAMLIFNEARELNFSFYLGLGLIVLSVALQTAGAVISKRRKEKEAVGGVSA